MRQLHLHVSALNDLEHDLYTASILEIVDGDDSEHDDQYFEQLVVGVREARAWLKGRYTHVLPSTVDTVSAVLCYIVLFFILSRFSNSSLPTLPIPIRFPAGNSLLP